MKNDEFELIKNPLLILGGNDDDPISDDDKDESKDDRNIFKRLWDWISGRE